MIASTVPRPHRVAKIASRSAALAAFLLLAVGCQGEQGRQGPQGPAGADGAEGPQGPAGEPGELSPTLSTWDKALAGVGGQAALESLASFRIEASGVRSSAGETYAAGAPAEVISTYDVVVSYDIASDGARLDYMRNIIFAGGVDIAYSEIINGNLGYVDGNDSFFGAAFSTTDMPSARWASTQEHLRLLNPQLILKDIAANASIASEAGVALHNGVIHELLEVQHDVYPITLWINAATGRIAKLTTMINDHLHRDTEVEVHYHGWQDFAEGAAFANDVFIVMDGEIVHEEYRSAIEVNPTLAADLFTFPDGAAPTYDAEAAAWGAANHQFHQSFTGLGIPLDVEQSYVAATELATGVWFLTGGSHNSMVVEQANGLVVIEPPLYPERSAAILDWIAAEPALEGKTVTHVIVTHHHEDHAGGLREFVAAGATAVVSAKSEDFFADILEAPSTITPDTLASNPVTPDIVSVPAEGSYSIDDVSLSVAAYHTASVHANDLLIVHVPSGGFLFESDLYNPGGGGSSLNLAFAVELLDSITSLGLTVNTLVGGHGASAPLTELQDYIQTNQQ